MTFRRTHRLGAAALASGVLLLGGLTPATAMPAASGSGSTTRTCFDPAAWGLGGSAARGAHGGVDHRGISRSEQRAIAAKTRRILDRKGTTTAARTSAQVPVYVHQMLSKRGAGAVTDQQVAAQVAELNQDFAGGEGGVDTGFTFVLAGNDRFYNDQWHKDRQSSSYRSQTRKGGRNALNIWLVDFGYLGIATFPWDDARNPRIDGIRVQYTSLPGGSATNYNQGKTASHEAGHWFGLYHTFQGGCTSTNDEVADTPAQSSSTAGCPEGRDSCSLPGLDPIHNYMDYSYDQCYRQFTSGQSARMDSMWAAYRA